MWRSPCPRQVAEAGPHLIPGYQTIFCVAHTSSPHWSRAYRLAIAIAWWKNVQHSLIMAMREIEFRGKSNLHAPPVHLRDTTACNRDGLARNTPDSVIPFLECE